MKVINYNKSNEIIEIKDIQLNISIIYEIIKKYVADIKLENM